MIFSRKKQRSCRSSADNIDSMSRTKPCPVCGQQMPSDAHTCRSCKRFEQLADMFSGRDGNIAEWYGHVVCPRPQFPTKLQDAVVAVWECRSLLLDEGKRDTYIDARDILLRAYQHHEATCEQQHKDAQRKTLRHVLRVVATEKKAQEKTA